MGWRAQASGRCRTAQLRNSTESDADGQRRWLRPGYSLELTLAVEPAAVGAVSPTGESRFSAAERIAHFARGFAGSFKVFFAAPAFPV